MRETQMASEGVKLDKTAVDVSALEGLFAGAGQPLTDEEREYARALGILPADTDEHEQDDTDVADTDETDADDVDTDDNEDTLDADADTDTDEVDEDEDAPKQKAKPDTTATAPEPDTSKAKPSSAKQKLSKEQMRIIEQKRLIKEQADKLAEYERKARLAELQDEYGKTMDADTASVMAQSGYELERMKQELAVTRFIAQHRDTLVQYDVLDDAEDIMARAKAADMTVAEYCRGKYGDAEPLQVSRQKAAATGKLTNQSDKSDFAVANAQSQAQSKPQAKLTSSDRELMKRLAQAGFADITAEELQSVRKGLTHR